MIETASRAAARTDGDGRGATGTWQHHAPRGPWTALARFPTPARTIQQAARANLRLIIAFVSGTITEGNENGESWLT